MNDHDPKTCDLSLWVGPGCRYPTLEDMARDAMRWHDEAQAEKMACMKAEEDVRLLRSANFEMVRQRAWLMRKLNESDCERAALQARIDAGVRAVCQMIKKEAGGKS